MNLESDGKRLFRLTESEGHVEAQVDDELHHHLEELLERYRAQGMNEDEIRAAIARRFPDLEAARSDLIASTGRTVENRRRRLYLDSLRSDLRVSLRQFHRRPGFTAVVVLTLALGIGLTTAVFTLVNGVLLKPLPFSEPDRLVRIWAANPTEGVSRGVWSYPDFRDYREATELLEDLSAFAGFRMGGAILTGVSEPVELATSFVSGDFFTTLGVEPLLGRLFTPDEDIVGQDRVALVSHGWWQRAWGGDPGLIGRTLILDGEPVEIVGVMPPNIAYPWQDPALWVPLSWITEIEVPHIHGVQWLSLVGRMQPGVSVEQVEAEAVALRQAFSINDPPAARGWDSTTAASLHEAIAGTVRSPLLILLAAVAAILLIVCANVANLLLARAVGREHEIAIRTSLGAGTGRLIRQLLTESGVIALAGGTAGFILAWGGSRLLVSLAPAELPRTAEIVPDLRVLLFAVAISLLTALVFGLLPALRAARRTHHRALRLSPRSGEGPAGRRLTGILVAAQVALAVVLVTGAGLMARTLVNLYRVDLGFDPGQVLTFHVSLGDDYADEAIPAYFREARQRLSAIPGVAAAGAVKILPTTGQGEPYGLVPADRVPPGGPAPVVETNFATPGYFEAMRIPLLAGRTFRETDDRTLGRIVVIVNQAYVDRWFDGEAPTGSSFPVGTVEVEFIGVVGNVRHSEPAAEPEPMLYLCQFQQYRSVMSFVVRTRSDPRGIVPQARSTLAELDPDQPFTHLATLEEVVDDAIARPRSVATLLGLFALLAGLLAAVGLYGVLSFSVARRTRELGIRQALGARRSTVVAMVVREGMYFVLGGLIAGVITAAIAGRLLESMLFGITSADPLALFAAALVLIITGLLASTIPAARAARTHPAGALREE
jgi:predicted permease